ncbi:MAG: hypothetical protein K9N06_01695 [Candidatus Cloacimonetes bacterium]|nr:hypothetical protein [Candidatus Cloacimonadota bacterium]
MKENITEQDSFFSFEMPTMRHIELIMKAGTSNPFISQFFSILFSRRATENLMQAPLEFTVCADVYKVTKVFEKNGEADLLNEKALFFLAMQDSVFAAHSMAFQAEQLGLRIKYIPLNLERVKEIRKKWNLPDKVVPFLTVSMGYPEKKQTECVTFPREFIFFEDEYPAANDFLIDELMYHLDEEEELIEYYKHIDKTCDDITEKKSWCWYKLLRRNCLAWEESLSEFDKILKLCGINL